MSFQPAVAISLEGDYRVKPIGKHNDSGWTAPYFRHFAIWPSECDSGGQLVVPTIKRGEE